MADQFNWISENQMRHLIQEITDYAALGPNSEGFVMGQRYDDGAVLVTIAVAPKKVLDKTPD